MNIDKDTVYRWLRLIGLVCTTILAIIGALGVDVPSIQEFAPAAAACAVLAPIINGRNHWKNNNYTLGAKIVQPQIKEINTAIKDEVVDMGKGDENE